MITSHLMEHGSLIRNMVMYGSRIYLVDFILTEPVVTGFGLMNTNGYGFLTIAGLGSISLWPVAFPSARRLGLGAGHDLGTGVGQLALR